MTIISLKTFEYCLVFSSIDMVTVYSKMLELKRGGLNDTRMTTNHNFSHLQQNADPLCAIITLPIIVHVTSCDMQNVHKI